MCGLVGMAGNLFKNDVDSFNQMLYADYFRGPHATGVGAVRGQTSSVLKRAWSPLELMSHKNYDNTVTVTCDALIGHNRHGTRGSNSDHNNAHPFNFDRIIGAHNGTLDHPCIGNLKDNAKFDTDSEALFCDINANGIDESIQKISGAWALTFFDKKEKTINLIRNAERPLFFAYKKGRSVLYWASEYELMMWILNRNRIEVEEDTAYELPVDTLFTWKVSTNVGEPAQRELKSTLVCPWKDPNKKWDQATSRWIDKPVEDTKQTPPFQETLAKNHGGNTSPSSTALVVIENTTKSTRRQSYESTRLKPPYINPLNNNVIGKAFFDHIMERNTCAFCEKDDLKWGDAVKFLPHQNHQDKLPDFLCESCWNDKDIRDLCVSNA